MSKMTIKAPIVLFHEGKHVPIGTPVSLDRDEAESLTARFGTYTGPDVGSVSLSAADATSLQNLNTHSAIHRGFGEGSDNVKLPAAGTSATPTDAPPIETDLHAMTKAELLAEAESLRVPDVKAADSKGEIIEKIEAFHKANG